MVVGQTDASIGDTVGRQSDVEVVRFVDAGADIGVRDARRKIIVQRGELSAWFVRLGDCVRMVSPLDLSGA